jgi:hypothetical protein
MFEDLLQLGQSMIVLWGRILPFYLVLVLVLVLLSKGEQKFGFGATEGSWTAGCVKSKCSEVPCCLYT